MRIALLTPGFSADERDWCIPALLDLVRELAREHDVQVFTLRYPHRRDRYQVHGATVHALGGATAGGLHRLPLLARALAAVGREQRRAPFNVLHGLWADEPGFLAVLAGRLLGAPSVVSLLGGELVGFADIGYGGQLSRANRWLTRAARRGADRVTVGSRYLGRIAGQHGVPDGKLVLMPLGVDTKTFRVSFAAETPCAAISESLPQPNPKGLAGHPALLHVAALSPVKDQATLLRATALVSSRLPDVHLHIVGGGPLRPALAALAQALGLADRVTFHGAVAHQRLATFYRSADLLVQSSRYESQGLVVLEAAACGCPCVGTAVGLLPELLPPLCLAEPGDAAGLAAAIAVALQSPARQTGLGRMAQRQVQARFSLDRTLPTLLNLYEDLMKP